MHKASLPSDLKAALEKHPCLGARRGFKFTTASIARGMREQGLFKIGRLDEFRVLESKQLQDTAEGLNAVRSQSEIEYNDLPTNSIVRKVVRNDQSIKLTVIVHEGATIAWPFDFPTFCFSYSDGDAVRQSIIDPTNGYDDVVQISDVFELSEIMADHLSKTVGRSVSYICAPVVYRRTARRLRDSSPENLAAAFEKSAQFEANCEGRIVFFFADDREHCKIWMDQAQTIPFDGLIKIPEAQKLLS